MNVLPKIGSHRNSQKRPSYLALISWGRFCEFLCDPILGSTFLKKTDFSLLPLRAPFEPLSNSTIYSNICYC